MDSLTLYGLVFLALAAVCFVGATSAGIVIDAAPALGRLVRMRRLGLDVRQLAAEHAAAPPPRVRHNAHCPACGRFAHVTSAGPRGIRTRCKAHGVRLRVIKRIGEPERHLISISAYRPLVGELPALPMLDIAPLTLAPPARMPDWLDGVTVPTLRRALAA